MYYIAYVIANFPKVFGIWFVLTIINQVVFFGACLQPYCILASIPHISVLTAIIAVAIFKDDEEAKENAEEMTESLNRLLRIVVYGSLILATIGLFGYVVYKDKINNSSSSQSTIYTAPIQTPQERCVSNGNEWDYTNWQCVYKYSLHIQTNPSDARVQIMNIKPKYYDGIKLKSGRYDIRVSRRGYHTENFYIDFYSSGNYSSNLIRK